MAYVITQNCCKDASCVAVCPVDCIRPSDVDPLGDGSQMLFIDPETCIDCGACYDECPVDAIYADSDLPEELAAFETLNAEYFQQNPLEPAPFAPARQHPPVADGDLRVAVVGAGPAGCYAAAELLAVRGVQVQMFERLPVPYGLVRYGVAPDHQHTKSVVTVFDSAFTNKRFTCRLNVDVGGAVTHDDLLASHHAVVYAVGAPGSRPLGIDGEHLPGHHPVADFVGWYNGHPDHVDAEFDFSSPTAVIIGNGNVAIDAARVLLMSHEDRCRTDLAPHAIEALQASRVEEVVLLGRRDVRHGAFSAGEFLALGNLDGIDVVISGGALDARPDDDVETAAKLTAARDYAARPPIAGNRRMVFRFLESPTALVGETRVENVECTPTAVDADGHATPTGAATTRIDTGLVLSSIGYRGRRVDGLPFDEARGVIPNEEGRVVSDHGPMTGVYVTGWIKRGPRGVIGTNRACAEQTVAALLDDYDAGVLAAEIGDAESLSATLAERGVDEITWTQWRAIDAAERAAGKESGRPRVKFVTVADMLAASRL